MQMALQTCHQLIANGDFHGALAQIPPLAGNPAQNADILLLKASVLSELGQYDEATALLEPLVAATPGDNRVLVQLADCHEKAGRRIEAIELLRIVAARMPIHSCINTLCRLLVAQGQELSCAGRDYQALPFLQEAANINPSAYLVLLNLGNVATRLNEPAEGERLLRMYLSYYPGDRLALVTLAAALSAQSKSQEAEAVCREVLALPDGDVAECWTNLGVALMGQLRYADAQAAFERATELLPDLAEALINLGTLASFQGQHAQAQAYYARARATGRRDIWVDFNASLALLRAGDWEEGWSLYESRFDRNRPNLHKLPAAVPRWDGAAAAGKRVLLASEQGFGDSLQFFRYARMLADQGAAVGMVTEPGLERLFRQSDPRLTLISDPAAIVPSDWDGGLPIMSMPRIHGTRVDNVPDAVPYLSADPREVAAWRRRLQALPGLRVGLVWAGAARPGDPEAASIDRRRSLTLSRLDPLAQVAGVSFVSLQMGPPTEQIAASPLAITDWTAELSDFADTAALVTNLDLMICVDTAIAHLAGGLGVPTFVLSRYDGCWRWLHGRDDTVWYPTMRLFRQPAPGDWDTPIAALVDALAGRA